MLMMLAGLSHPHDEERVLAALAAARAVLDLAGIHPAMAWRDHLAVADWRRKHRPTDMIAAAEEEGAQLWRMALNAARRSLGMRQEEAIEIDLVQLPGMPNMPEAHGPTRFVWRRHWQWRLDTWAAEVFFGELGQR